MEIIFGRKYPIQQKANANELTWLSVEFEKDITGKVIYRLEAVHPRGKKISYLKGRDYLLSEDIQKSMIRNFEVKLPEVEFDSNQKAYYEVTLPYDFLTRYLPLKVETDTGYQEVVLRLRFGDYKFMLASRVLNTVSNIETTPIIAAKTVDQLFAKREQLKKRPPKLIEKQENAEVNVDDIYNVISKDLNITSRIVTDVDKALAAESAEKVMDDFDSLLNKYSVDEEAAKVAVDAGRGLEIKSQQLKSNSASAYESAMNENNLDTSGLSQDQKDILNNPTTEDDYNAYVEDLVKEKSSGEFNANASIDEIIAQAGQFDSAEQAADIAKSNASLNDDEDTDGPSEKESFSIDDLIENADVLLTSEETKKEVVVETKQIAKAYIAPVDTEELFGLPSEDWVEPKSAPILVIKPKPIDQKRRIASYEPPKRNNFVEMTPAPKPKAAEGVNMDELFGGESGASPSGFGF